MLAAPRPGMTYWPDTDIDEEKGQTNMEQTSVSIALTGSGGAGVMTAGQILLDAAAKAGFYGLMGRALGPQIRGGESAALVRLSTKPVQCVDDGFDIIIAFDWGNFARFHDEMPLKSGAMVIADPHNGEVPDVFAASRPRQVMVPFHDLAQGIKGGRVNMVGLGLIADLIGLDQEYLIERLRRQLARKGPEALDASIAGLTAGKDAAINVKGVRPLAKAEPPRGERWSLTGNEAAGLGAIQGGIRFCAAYPITPATDVLEWLAPNLPKVGGMLVQCEDELSSINMLLGASFGGTPSLTATSGPGLALMTESIGLAVASETPLVVINVQRGGPSTGIPTKSEQADLDIAVHGLHGDAPHLVTAPLSIGDCLFTAQWSVYLAESLQTPVIMLSDQGVGQSRAIIDKPTDIAFVGKRVVPEHLDETYQRYALTADGVSPMALPGMKGASYTAEGLEHNPFGHPSTQANFHQEQLSKRQFKLKAFEYGDHWATILGDDDADVVVLTWGSTTEPAREAVERAREEGIKTRLVAARLVAPVPVPKMRAALAGAKHLVVVEQNHSGQYYRLVRAHVDLPGVVHPFHRPGPLSLRPNEILAFIRDLDV